MAQVSKKLLNKDIEERILNTLWDGVSFVKDYQEARMFLEDLLTPTEKIMLSKRLAIAVLLTKGYGYLNISNTLRVSSDTIKEVSNWLKISGNGYRLVINRLLKQERWIRVLATIDDFLYSLPHPSGKKVFGPKPARRKIKPKTI